MSEFFLSAFSCETAHVITKSNLLLGFDILDRIEKRVFRQYFYDNPLKIKNADVKFNPFIENSEKIWEISNHRDRIHRAIRWFKKGINADDPLDQFLFFEID